MRIIREGKIPEEKTYTVECHYCKTAFEFAQKEGRYQPDQRDGDYIEIACPTCKKPCTVAVGLFK